ncbi:MAG: 4-(cytidine 5'-diphospho)-2-C-methyl-D-erythritol kinase [Dehalococcoidia bacterium]|nr:4-(cytidine 5'-diphospho)-2-C-methyl-D-erythritol kinase [Dehalococcoidia bacterium]
MLTFYAPAKVNLILEVLGKHGNYHRISSIVQAVSLYDVLNFEPSEDICLECNELGLERDNLVTETAMLLKKATGYSKGARIELYKHIPWGAGLGGGSSDAAATLLALNELWELRLSLSELAHLASKLGSDVPFFIYKGIALVEGKGEKVTPLPSLPSTWFVLLVPPLPRISGKTAQMYGKLNTGHFTEGQFVRAALPSLMQRKMFDSSLMVNVFEEVEVDIFPQIKKYRKAFEEAGASGIHLSGSGPCLFTFFSEEEKANELFLRLGEQRLECYAAVSL